MRIYETMFLIDPTLDEETRESFVSRVKSWIEEKAAGTIRNVDRWGMRQLAFRVNKFFEGDYTVILFDADPSNVKVLEEMYRITPQIFRWIVFRREDLEKLPPAKPVEETEEAEAATEASSEGENS